MKLTPQRFRRLLNLYVPYLGAGVHVTHIAEDWREVRVEMKLRWYNRNAVGTHFGGSLYAMIDPHLMLMLIQLLGKDYVVWDKSATIDFVSPGTGTVFSTLTITDADLATIREKTAQGEKYLHEFEVQVLDSSGKRVTQIKKVLYIRQKKRV